MLHVVNSFYFYLTAFLLLTVTFQVNAQPVYMISDDEIENIVRELSEPLFASAGLDPKRAEIFIVNDNSVNAFTNGGHRIYINSGLLKISDKPDMVMGVIAHEIGHIKLGHPARIDERLSAALDPIKMATLGVLSGIAAMLTGNPALLALAAGSVQGDWNQYSRIQESAADTASVDILRKAGVSLDGSVEVMTTLDSMSKYHTYGISSGPLSIYHRSHPFTKDRIDYLQNELQSDINKGVKIGELEQRERFYVAVNKLRAYTNPIPESMRKFSEGKSYSDRYAMAIVYMRTKEFNKAELIVNELIAERRDPYVLELRASIRNAMGSQELALSDLEEANNLQSDKNNHIRLQLIEQKINSNSTDIGSIISELNEIVAARPANGLARYLLARAYSSSGREGMSQITLARLYLAHFNEKLATKHLSIAKQYAKNDPGLNYHVASLESEIKIIASKQK